LLVTAPRTQDDSIRSLEEFNPYDPSLADNVYEVLARARQECPVAHSQANEGFWLISSYEHAKAVLHDDNTFLSGPGKSLPVRQTHPMPPLDSDPPMHRHFRLLLNRFFSRTGLEPHASAIQEIAERTVVAWASAGRCEFMEEFANPFTAAVLARVILNLDDDTEIRRVQHLVEAVGSANASAAWQDLSDFVRELLAQRVRAAEQPDDVLGGILQGQVDGRLLTEAERIGVATVLLLGGLDTTKAALGNIMWRITQDPDIETRMRHSDWVRSGLDEFLRLDSPVTALARTVANDTRLGDVQLRAGDHVLVHYASANRDATVFDRPDHLDLDRLSNPHLAFGLGIHRCIGSNLARMSIAAAINEVLGRITDIGLAPGAEVHFSPGSARHPLSLELVFQSRH
jgi:cytochrome P450